MEYKYTPANFTNPAVALNCLDRGYALFMVYENLNEITYIRCYAPKMISTNYQVLYFREVINNTQEVVVATTSFTEELTKLEIFAKSAMQGMLANSNTTTITSVDEIIARAYRVARLMCNYENKEE